ncbi:sensor histidine kinase [Roseburia sp. AF15-21]|uniref:sensor histidine kinase n=1 Tax=Roseburia sp. AF15-21 TaxID=2293128 RepID=UPI001313F165|nr:sensor histidine kinase [Roseburia sp. AF15-21]
MSADDIEEKSLKIGLGIYCLLTTTVYSIFQVSFVYEICNCLGIIGITCFYQEMWKKRLWVSLVLFSLDMANSLIVLFVFGDIAKFQQPAVQVLLMLIFTTIINHISYLPETKEIAFDRKQTLLLLVIPAMSIIVLSVLMLGELEKMFAILISGCMLIINISVFYLYNILIENYIHLRDNDIYKQQTYAYQNQLEVIMESQNRVRALRHDMKNHILALQVLIQRKEVEEANQYLDSMKNFMTNPQEYVKTGNDMVDSLLNYKIQKANEVLNVVETKISIPEQLRLHSFDLNVLLGNLLDNAIDASMQTENKKLKITIKLDKGILFLNICNSCQRIVGGRKNFLETTKEDKVNHGIGLKNVHRIVEKYHGDIEFIYENDSMETDVMMYVKEM